MTSPQIHLTQSELDEALLGMAPQDCMAHLKDCVACNAHLAEFKSTLTSFNQAASAWSEAKSNALTRDLNQHCTPFRITARAAWSCASILVLAAAATLGFGLHERSTQITPAQAETASSEASSQREIASDDAMLRQIDSAIDTAEPSPEDLYGIQSASTAPHQNFNRTQVKD
jgi:anti-sigma factor RsiW